MILRTPILALALIGIVAPAAAPLPVEDPPPFVVKNAAAGLFAETWGIRVSAKPAPIGIIKIYDLENNLLGAMQGPGDCFNLKPGQAVKVAVCPEPRPAGAEVAVTLDFAKASNRDEPPPPAASVTFKQVTANPAKPAPVPFEVLPIRGKVKVDKDAYLATGAETPFVTLGRN
jgi:hypothetical protein